MNYRHIYHAGSFADVFKHLILIALIQSLLRKDKPFCYIDTHAGIGNYDLQTENAQKTQEYKNGVFKIWHKEDNNRPMLVTTYLQIIQAWNKAQGNEGLRYYPGSPIFAQQLLRAIDSIILSELHPVDIQTLKQQLRQDKRIAVHHLDGYAVFKALLPPKKNRGLVFIDPAFEKENEFDNIIKQLKLGVSRWRNGIYAIWYPIKNSTDVNYFYKNLIASGISKILACELHLADPSLDKMQACGMIIVNPPWQFKETMEATLPWLCATLNIPKTGNYKITWLVPE